VQYPDCFGPMPNPRGATTTRRWIGAARRSLLLHIGDGMIDSFCLEYRTPSGPMEMDNRSSPSPWAPGISNRCEFLDHEHLSRIVRRNQGSRASRPRSALDCTWLRINLRPLRAASGPRCPASGRPPIERARVLARSADRLSRPTVRPSSTIAAPSRFHPVGSKPSPGRGRQRR
jgi:hypothetical protein